MEEQREALQMDVSGLWVRGDDAGAGPFIGDVHLLDLFRKLMHPIRWSIILVGDRGIFGWYCGPSGGLCLLGCSPLLFESLTCKMI